MGREYKFFVEYKEGAEWKCVPELIVESEKMEHANSLFDIKVKSGLANLFFYENSLFLMNKGFPVEALSSAVDIRVGAPHKEQWWLEFADIYFEDWKYTSLIITDEVLYRFAKIFNDGTNKLPVRELLDAGMESERIHHLECSENVKRSGESIDWNINYFSGSENDYVPVTWKKSVKDIMGENICGKIQQKCH